MGLRQITEDVHKLVPLEIVLGPIVADAGAKIRYNDAVRVTALAARHGKPEELLGAGAEGVAYETDQGHVMKIYMSNVYPYYNDVGDDVSGMAPYIDPYVVLAKKPQRGRVHVLETFQSERDDKYAIAIVVMEKLEDLDSLFNASQTLNANAMDMEPVSINQTVRPSNETLTDWNRAIPISKPTSSAK